MKRKNSRCKDIQERAEKTQHGDKNGLLCGQHHNRLLGVQLTSHTNLKELERAVVCGEQWCEHWA